MDYTSGITDHATAYGVLTDALAPAPARSERRPDTTAFGVADAPSCLAMARSTRRPGFGRALSGQPTLNFASWNVRTLMESDKDRPERRTAFVANELKRQKIDVAALCETRFPDEGQLREEKAGYTFFWKGLPKTDRRIHGVGFAIRTKLLRNLNELPTGISERLMVMRLELAHNQYMSVISAYLPTLDADVDVKEPFYAARDELLTDIPTADNLVLLGDFNARVGRDKHLWPPIR